MILARILGFIAFIVYRLYSFTFRYEIQCHDKDVERDLKVTGSSKGNFIYAFWHQDELALVARFSYRKIVAMVSLSKDGTIMSTALSLFGYITIRGSSSRRGMQGLIEGIKHVKNGYKFVMAVDGPRGPIFKSKEGIVKLSNMSGRPIVPARAFPQSFYTFERAWNKARLPMPFSKIIVVLGKAGTYNTEELELAIDSLTVRNCSPSDRP